MDPSTGAVSVVSGALEPLATVRLRDLTQALAPELRDALLAALDDAARYQTFVRLMTTAGAVDGLGGGR